MHHCVIQCKSQQVHNCLGIPKSPHFNKIIFTQCTDNCINSHIAHLMHNANLYIYIYIHTHTHIYTYIYTYIATYIYIYTYIDTYIHIYISTYIYTHTFTLLVFYLHAGAHVCLCSSYIKVTFESIPVSQLVTLNIMLTNGSDVNVTQFTSTVNTSVDQQWIQQSLLNVENSLAYQHATSFQVCCSHCEKCAI